ncbi:AI-2E family transporter [Halocella sp. SP3-1]|uniref:AI-2E family transporter n=1 Tax=Halocella sp. SP3-1 TaxID=2382161 RepID=UPI000F753364|nr:AI-2E family transporter [Halocella sp. SP3-1]AZO95711.1 AI-2E family transporter [Halocella sp. SP3-1]
MEIEKKDFKIIIMLLLTWGIIYFLMSVKTAVIPFVFGIILAYLFYPIVCFLRERNVSRSWAIYILLLLFLLMCSFIALIMLPLFINELEGLTQSIPEYIRTIDEYISYLNREYHRIQLPVVIKEVIDGTLSRLEEQMIAFIQNITEIIINSLSILISLVIAPFITYYILKDLPKIKREIIKIIPADRKRLFLEVGRELNKMFVAYLRGQIWISIIVGFLTGISLFILKLKFFTILAVIATFSNMIPFIGPFIGAVPAVFIALRVSMSKALIVALIYFVIQQLESSIISPKIMSENVGIHPLGVIFSLLVGAELMGVWGLIFAVPIAGTIKVVFKLIIRGLEY